jgi:hypothetical protein
MVGAGGGIKEAVPDPASQNDAYPAPQLCLIANLFSWQKFESRQKKLRIC